MIISLSVLVITLSILLILQVKRTKIERALYDGACRQRDHAEEMYHVAEQRAIMYKNKYQTAMSLYSTQEIPAGTLDAVRYAVKKSHPDNGGKAEDFIKFNEILKQLKEKEE